MFEGGAAITQLSELGSHLLTSQVLGQQLLLELKVAQDIVLMAMMIQQQVRTASNFNDVCGI